MTSNTSSTQPKTLAAIMSAGALLAALCACGERPAASPDSPDILVTVDGRAITTAQFALHRESLGGGMDSPESRRATLDDLVRRFTLAEQARAAGLAEDPEVVAQFENLLVRRLRETKLEPSFAAVEVSDDEVAAWYESNKESRFASPARDRLAVLWFGTRGLAPLAGRYRPRLESARDTVVEHPDAFPAAAGFGSLAIECSEHRASRYRGGDLGWINATETVPGGDSFPAMVATIGRGLAGIGDVSPVTESGDGLFVVRLVDREPAGIRPLDQVRDEIRRELLAGKRQAIEEAFESEALAGAAIVRHTDRLEALDQVPAPTDSADDAESSGIAAIASPGPARPKTTH